MQNNKKYRSETLEYIAEVREYLSDSDSLLKIDEGTINQLAYYFDAFTRISEIILSEGAVNNEIGRWENHPLSKELELCQIQLLKLQQEMGLTLRSRSKIKVLEKQEGGSLLEQWIELR